jgi:hypothetical protein
MFSSDLQVMEDGYTDEELFDHLHWTPVAQVPAPRARETEVRSSPSRLSKEDMLEIKTRISLTPKSRRSLRELRSLPIAQCAAKGLGSCRVSSKWTPVLPSLTLRCTLYSCYDAEDDHAPTSLSAQGAALFVSDPVTQAVRECLL